MFRLKIKECFAKMALGVVNLTQHPDEGYVSFNEYIARMRYGEGIDHSPRLTSEMLRKFPGRSGARPGY